MTTFLFRIRFAECSCGHSWFVSAKDDKNIRCSKCKKSNQKIKKYLAIRIPW